MLMKLLLGICGDVTSGSEPDSYFFCWDLGKNSEEKTGGTLEEKISAAEPRDV